MKVDIENKRCPYEAPMAEVFFCPKPLSLLVSVSIEVGVENWEEGDEL